MIKTFSNASQEHERYHKSFIFGPLTPFFKMSNLVDILSKTVFVSTLEAPEVTRTD